MYMHEDQKLVKATIWKVTNEVDSTKHPLPMAMDEIQFIQKKTILVGWGFLLYTLY